MLIKHLWYHYGLGGHIEVERGDIWVMKVETITAMLLEAEDLVLLTITACHF